MRRRSRLLLILGILLAIVAMLITYTMLQKPQQPAEQPPVVTRKVAVALQDIPYGTLIDPLAVEMRDWPVDTAPADAIGNTADLAGKYAKTAIFAGQIIQAKMIASPSELAAGEGPASVLVPLGMVAYPFPIDELSGVSYALKSGDRVDVLITFRFLQVDRETQVAFPLDRNQPGDIQGVQIPRLVSQLTLQNVEVLRVGSWYVPPVQTTQQQQPGQQQQTPATPPPPAVVTLLVPQQDALVLQFAREAKATVELALRNPNDQEEVTTQAVTLDYMLARFNITVPILRDESLETLKPATR
ncbi:MAG: Flp pilus assembly protein CpaB [Chloroflexi bacterium]|nr:Flp pilus assembly protein CpaB [Chloroflexota bacterium]